MEELERRAGSFGPTEGMTNRMQPRPVPDVHEPGVYESVVKPVVDRLAGVLLSIITFPIVLVVVPMIWSTMGRPAIFRQVRIGRFGEEFTVYKFRTMGQDRRVGETVAVEEDRRVNHKSDVDPRHTDIGRVLRKWSLDEIPQFWNMALGNMSLVGPRPELPRIVERYEPWQHARHEVKPGLTGLWQVSARGDAPMHEATDIDIAYVDAISFKQDVSIALRTPAAVLGSRKGH